ncbi:MAG TPA: helix-turn-helix domain-containing protein [Opitutaceae bacterium]|nr:helix-turn-helix domain-containing protein [Opitutaceae bacterium]
MTQSSSDVDAAFVQLLSALEAEGINFQKLGGEIFHGGAPREAQGLLRRSQANIGLRNEVAALHEKWRAGLTTKPATPALGKSSVGAVAPGGPGLIRNIDGVSESEAARALGTTPAKVRALLEAGTLKGYRRVSGTWKIARTDLIDFIRNRR